MITDLKALGIECVTPEGWLKNQLVIQSKGLTRKLHDVWDSTGSYSGWLGGTGEDWERGPYYIDGVLPLAYYTKDQELLEIAMKFIRWTLQSQDGEGNFGPVTSKKDWWSRVVMLKVMIQYYEIYKEEDTLDFAEKYFAYMNQNLDINPIKEWGAARVPDLLYCVMRFNSWRPLPFYNQLVETLQKQTLDWCELYQNFPFTRPTAYYYKWDTIFDQKVERYSEFMQYHQTHIVNVTMGLKHPAIQYMLTGDDTYRSILEKGIEQLRHYHGVATGMFNGDEHLSGANPTQGTELCAVVEYMFSLEVIMEALGEGKYADMLEKIAYNALPATITEDFMAHQYLQQVNQIKADNQKNKWYNNADEANTYGLEPHFGCCTSNMHQGWPKFLRGLWFAKQDTICAMAYAPCRLETEVNGKKVVLIENTEYPFKGTISFQIKSENHTFGVQLRVPEWCKEYTVLVNKEPQTVELENGFITLTRQWQKEDTIVLQLQMEIQGSRWYNNSLAVERGPLLYGLALHENWEIIKTAGGIPDYRVYTNDTWNYALAELASITAKENDVTPIPFSRNNPPVELCAKGKKVESWKEENNHTTEIPNSPVKTESAEEEIKLIPYGCTKLRIAQFPTLF